MPSKRNRQPSQGAPPNSNLISPALASVQKWLFTLTSEFQNRKEFLGQTFVAISMNYLVGNKYCDYIPIEIGLQCFNFARPAPFEDFHKFIKQSPDDIPSGFLFNAMEYEKFHKIPQKGLPNAITDYKLILNQIELLLRNDAKNRKYVLYCARSEIIAVKSALGYLNYGNFPVGLVAIEDLFIVVKWLVQSDRESINEPDSDFIIKEHTEIVRRLEGHRLHLFSNNCPFHQNLDCPNCSIGIVRRFWLHLDEYLSEIRPKINRILGLQPNNLVPTSNFNVAQSSAASPAQDQSKISLKDEIPQSATYSQNQDQSKMWKQEKIQQNSTFSQAHDQSKMWKNNEIQQNPTFSQGQDQCKMRKNEEIQQNPSFSQFQTQYKMRKNEEIQQNPTFSLVQDQSKMWKHEEIQQNPATLIGEPLSGGSVLKSCLKNPINPPPKPQETGKVENTRVEKPESTKKSIDANLSRFLIAPQQKEPMPIHRDGFGSMKLPYSTALSRYELRQFGLIDDDTINTTGDDEELARINSESSRQTFGLQQQNLSLAEMENFVSVGSIAISSPMPENQISKNFNFMQKVMETSGQEKFAPLSRQQAAFRANQQAGPVYYEEAGLENVQNMAPPESPNVRLPEKWLRTNNTTNWEPRSTNYSIQEPVNYSIYRSRPHSFAKNAEN